MQEIATVFGLNGKLLLVQAVNFGVLVLVLWYFLYGPVIKMLDARREKIAKGIEDAARADERLQEVEKERTEILAHATVEGTEILANSKARADEHARDAAAEAHNKAEKIIDDANKRAEEARERALQESREEIGKAAVLAAKKILEEK